MSVQVEGFKTFIAGANLEAFTLVKLDSTENQVVNVGSDEAPIGVTQDKVSSGDPVAVKLWGGHSTFRVQAGEAFAFAADLYSGAGGELVDTDPGSGTIRAKALEAASGDGSIVEVLPV